MQRQRHLGWLLAATLVASINLRLAVAAPGPVIESIRIDTGMSSGVAGLLITIPFICMSAFAFTGPPLLRRVSPYRVVLLALALVGGGTLARSVAFDPALLLLATVPIGAGIAVMGVALPVIVKEHFPARSGFVTGAYISAMAIGVIALGIFLIPLVDLVGGWRPAFALTAIPALLAMAMWIGVHSSATMPAGTNRRRHADPATTAIPLSKPGRVEFLAATSFGLQSMTYSALAAWVVALYVDLGWSAGTASLLVALMAVSVIPASLIVASLSQNRDRRPWIAGSVAFMCVGLFGVALVPDVAAWLWIAVIGLGGGAAFALQLALPIDIRATPLGVARLIAWMLGLGYLLSAATPIMIGVLRDVTGGFVLPMTLLAVLAAIGIGIPFLLPSPLPRLPESRPSAAREPEPVAARGPGPEPFPGTTA